MSTLPKPEEFKLLVNGAATAVDEIIKGPLLGNPEVKAGVTLLATEKGYYRVPNWVLVRNIEIQTPSGDILHLNPL